MAGSKTLSATARASAKRGVARRSAIETAAEALFLELGFERTTMDAVVRRARASKETVYRHYPNKERLFQAVVESMAAEMQGQGLDLPNGKNIESTLTSFGCNFLSGAASRRSIKLYWLIISEGAKFPHLARIFYTVGPASTQRKLAEWLENSAQAAHLSIADPHEASLTFLSLLFRDVLQRLLIGIDKTVRQDTIEAQARLAVKRFIAIYHR